MAKKSERLSRQRNLKGSHVREMAHGGPWLVFRRSPLAEFTRGVIVCVNGLEETNKCNV